MLANERENHAAVETELNMKNLGLADKLKEGNGELTGNQNFFHFYSFFWSSWKGVH